MFIYEKGRFHFGKVSFALPDGILVDTSDSEEVINGFLLHAPDRSFSIMLNCYNSEEDAHTLLTNLFHEGTGYKLQGEFEAISYAALTGYKGIYESKKCFYEEYALDVENGGEYNLLDIYVSIPKVGENFDEAYKNKVVSELLESILQDK